MFHPLTAAGPALGCRYTFVCTLAEKENDEVFGTGGEILRSLQRLMGHLAGLRDIELVDLLLERVEGMYALDQVSASPFCLFPDCEGFWCIAVGGEG